MNLSGLNALVTGASGGIGGAIAKELHKRGANLFISGRNEVLLSLLQNELSERCSTWVCDISNSTDAENMVKEIESSAGQIDILVNSAGIKIDKLSIRTSDENWNKVIQTNLTSVFTMSREVAIRMMKRRNGRIINISSIIGFTGNVGQTAYAAAKAGIIAVTKSMAKELAPRSITVNAIAPGYIATTMTEDLSDDIKTEILRSIPAGRTGVPEDIANAAAFLADPTSSYITGQTIHVNGGMYM